ncbi:hypothetical protein FOCG_16708 [Fusarium oxysporum f. sp. radicis-lycopersici 26381]|nr:hypothetical protein FOCG_16708 [Fusarium oxysporum f. sp. radicis-lycopersici 26381]
MAQEKGLSMYLFQHMRRAHKLPEASGRLSWQQSPHKLRDRELYGLVPDGTSAAKWGLFEMINSIRTGKPLKEQKLLVWDPDLFDDAHQELYRLQDNTGEFKWVRLEAEQRFMPLNDQHAPVPHFPSTMSIFAEFEGISTISERDSHTIHEPESEGSSDVSSIAGSDTEHPYGAGYAWRGARRAFKTKRGRYEVGP